MKGGRLEMYEDMTRIERNRQTLPLRIINYAAFNERQH